MPDSVRAKLDEELDETKAILKAIREQDVATLMEYDPAKVIGMMKAELKFSKG